jgi:hypothetical protein
MKAIILLFIFMSVVSGFGEYAHLDIMIILIGKTIKPSIAPGVTFNNNMLENAIKLYKYLVPDHNMAPITPAEADAYKRAKTPRETYAVVKDFMKSRIPGDKPIKVSRVIPDKMVFSDMYKAIGIATRKAPNHLKAIFNMAVTDLLIIRTRYFIEASENEIYKTARQLIADGHMIKFKDAFIDFIRRNHQSEGHARNIFELRTIKRLECHRVIP